MPKFGFGAHGPAEPEPAPEPALSPCQQQLTTWQIVHVLHARSEGLAASQARELELISRARSGENRARPRTVELHAELASDWRTVCRKLQAQAAGSSASPWLLILSGHGGGATFDGQPDSPSECAAAVCDLPHPPRLVVLNACDSHALAGAVHARRPAVSVAFWDRGEATGRAETRYRADLPWTEQMPALLLKQLAGHQRDIAAVLGATNARLAEQSLGRLGWHHQTRVLTPAELAGVVARASAGGARPARPVGERPSVESLYEQMQHTRVLWSFGTARGGVNLAIELQERLTDWHIVLNEKQLMVSPGNTRHWRIKAHAGQSIKWTFRECDQHRLDFRSCFVHAETQQGEEDWHTEMQHTCTATGECAVTRPGGARASPLCLSRLSLLTCASL